MELEVPTIGPCAKKIQHVSKNKTNGNWLHPILLETNNFAWLNPMLVFYLGDCMIMIINNITVIKNMLVGNKIVIPVKYSYLMGMSSW